MNKCIIAYSLKLHILGLGHNFLKHVERTKILLLIADVQGFKLSVEHPLRTCFETVLLLNKVFDNYICV